MLTVPLDLARNDAMARLSTATAGLEVGCLIANAGGDDYSAAFLDKDLDTHLALVQRNCAASWRPRTASADRWSLAGAVGLSW